MTTEAEQRSDAPPDAPPSPAPAPHADGSATAELADLKDRLLRALAENENFRRRAERERDEAVKFAAASLVKDLLATADNLARALASVPPEPAAQDEAMRNLLAGVAATERMLNDTFVKHGITKIVPVPGDSFDPELHQAAVRGSRANIRRVLSPKSFSRATPITRGCSAPPWLA
jgi:molecular chaperone GrpE